MKEGDFAGLNQRRSFMSCHIPPVFLVTPGLSSLEALWLDKNKLTDIPTGAFRPLVPLTHLFLCANQLSTLRGDMWEGLTSLQVLMLEYNGIKILPDAAFTPLLSLKTLDLMFNEMTTIRYCTTTSLKDQ